MDHGLCTDWDSLEKVWRHGFGELKAMAYLLTKATSYYPDWLAIRASFGMNGIFMRGQDVAAVGIPSPPLPGPNSCA